MPDNAQIAQAIRRLFDVPVGVVLTDPRQPQPDLWPGEDAGQGRVTPKRAQEFAAGRAAARAAMTQLGCAPAAIPAAVSRAPVWPAGVHGSISHSATLCLAVVCRRPCLLGVDIEPAQPMESALIPHVLGHDAPVGLNKPGTGLVATYKFSAKEAVFKAVFPQCEQVFGFDVVRIALLAQAGHFQARFQSRIGPYDVGDTLRGRYLEIAGHIVTAVTVDPTLSGH
ncbi:4'-phosphopantetheinyl transferase family protein [Sulfitobacter aestuariivivens]|uniref:Phosphopantetheinyl transferase n=1 Tax=Sulfitobacter aestuariivivens TaxID=2766981 RepID=A0A927D346_9RHOB|nr:4'-phosphopantetheinyl transferase superfamily protein [Sulfitobacter aestuariivivens]MBD3662397.1 phosphopantetheinyl transferase [Sulfitobacter aestuariivivens]